MFAHGSTLQTRQRINTRCAFSLWPEHSVFKLLCKHRPPFFFSIPGPAANRRNWLKKNILKNTTTLESYSFITLLINILCEEQNPASGRHRDAEISPCPQHVCHLGKLGNQIPFPQDSQAKYTHASCRLAAQR